MPDFTYTAPVTASPAALWALVRDVRRVASLFSFITLDAWEAEGAECWRYRRLLRIPSLSELCWHERSEVTGAMELRFQAIGGDLSVFQGRWLVEPAEDTAVLRLELTYEIPAGMGPKVAAGLARYVMEELFKTIGQRVKQAAEEGA